MMYGGTQSMRTALKPQKQAFQGVTSRTHEDMEGASKDVCSAPCPRGGHEDVQAYPVKAESALRSRASHVRKGAPLEENWYKALTGNTRWVYQWHPFI